ncbi:MAG: ABC transporter permease [Pyrinomonadaceae bacterium MAG19_C2-C3]|nr:ABC transporter permease [Pyrinomonadaceae bacterium MAG19_C2-C3]
MHFSPFIESFRIAASSLRANKLRTALTLVGVVVGVAAVISVVTIIKGLDYTVASTFSSQGSTVFSVTKRPQIVLSREDAIRFNKRKDVTDADYEAVARRCAACWRTGVAVNNFGTIKAGERLSEGVAIRGLTDSMFEIDDITVEFGRAWTEGETVGASNVCVVGADVVENVFSGAPPDAIIGRRLRVADRLYTIVGVAERLGNIFGFSRDSFVLIPYPAYKLQFGTKESIAIQVQVSETSQLADAQDQVQTILRTRRGRDFHDEDDGFSLETQDVFLDLYRKATANIYLVTIGVAAISLVVGGIVVMNIMLVSVTERTREIGIRKALGARRVDVLQQFLIESVMLTAIGGLIGVIAGFALAFALSLALKFPLLISLWSAVLGVGVSSLVGIISGISPAWKAARLNPIDALRSE